jgi:hypothetical protein
MTISASSFEYYSFKIVATNYVVWWLEFLATDPDISGLIPSAARFSEK